MRDARLELGHADIDDQHVAMFEEMDRLAALASGDDAAALQASLGRLWDLAIAHFATEESLMFAHGYLDRAAHESSHHLFLRELRELQEEVAQRGLTDEAAVRARRRIREWFEFHIEQNDLPLGRFLAKTPAAVAACPPRARRGEDA